MKSVINYTVVIILAVTVTTNAEMKLKLSSSITGETPQTFINNDLTSNLKLEVPAKVSTMGGMKDFVMGMILLGILADLTIPLGDENSGFKHIAGTGFSGHLMAAYVLSTALLLKLNIGYIKYGTQTSSEDFGGTTWSFEDKFSQIPIMLGLYYLISTHSAFKPFIGLALGIVIQSYTYKGTWSQSFGGQTYSGGESADKSTTAFGISPSFGFYYIVGSVMLTLAVEYLHILSDLKLSDSDYTINNVLQKNNNPLNINQEADTSGDSYSPKSFSINFGVAIPLSMD